MMKNILIVIILLAVILLAATIGIKILSFCLKYLARILLWAFIRVMELAKFIMKPVMVVGVIGYVHDLYVIFQDSFFSAKEVITAVLPCTLLFAGIFFICKIFHTYAAGLLLNMKAAYNNFMAQCF